MKKLPNHTALKEWASVISALQTGEQICILRKGGIADSRFAIEAEQFYLFPTYLHQKENQFKPEGRDHFAQTDRESEPAIVTISSWADVVRSWTISDLAALDRIEPLFIFTRETLDERFRFRADQKLQLLALRVWRLQSPVEVVNSSAYAGCRSWISLDDEIDTSLSSQTVEELALVARIEQVDFLLA
ncbi:MAG TPA: DUF1802 family protein [Thermoanaerobaculia bacterium]|nr:DUF1802 family protein [Thermoanaerobaculia bacterium]